MPYYFSNVQIAKLLRSISAVYEVKGKNRFRITAYQNAAETVEQTAAEIKDLWESGKLDTIAGFGQSIRGYLDELFRKGKVKHFEETRKEVPPFMFELLEIRGIGPKTAYRLAKELKVKTKAELLKKAKSGEISKLEGFGEKSQKEIVQAVSQHKKSKRYLLTTAYPVAQKILAYLRILKECEQAEPLGSIRRMSATVGDIDLAVASTEPKKVIDHFTRFREVKKISEAGNRKASVELNNGMHVDLMVSSPNSFGSLLQHLTGSKSHNVALREYALKKSLSVSDYGIKSKTKLHKFKTEEELYGFLSMDWIVPEMRENTGEIELGIKHKLPKIVKIDDIKGDLHLHSKFPIKPSHDLGEDNFSSMINKAKELKYEYIGFSEHSPGVSSNSKQEIIKLIEAKTNAIEQIKNSNKEMRILNLLEIDILVDGTLSVPIEGLKIIDGAIAGIHSAHSQDKNSITKRLLEAIYSPYVKIISHPTGRLLLNRESYDADWDKIFKECAQTGTMLEINAHPSRLDLYDTLAKAAIGFGVKLVINTDSHATHQMDNMKYGVSVARRAWAEKKNIANTSPWSEFKKLFSCSSS